MKDKTFCVGCGKKINTDDSCINDDLYLFEYRCINCYILKLENIVYNYNKLAKRGVLK